MSELTPAEEREQIYIVMDVLQGALHEKVPKDYDNSIIYNALLNLTARMCEHFGDSCLNESAMQYADVVNQIKEARNASTNIEN